MNILIVDDSNDKIAKIVSVIEEVSSNFNIDTVIDNYSAQLRLKEYKYDLLLVDLLLPLRKGQEPIPEGGRILVEEISRKRSLIPPGLIVGITQFEEYKENFSQIWKLLFFNKDSWIAPLKEIISHTSRSCKIPSSFIEIKPTIFVEGYSDLGIIREAINIFKPDVLAEVIIKSDNSAGASWVGNQVVAWAHSLHKNKEREHIRGIGLVDGDEPGVEAINEVNRVIKSDSSGAKSFKMFKLKPDYAIDILPLYKKGLALPITLEELYTPDFWSFSESQGWLEDRNNLDIFLKDPKAWDKRSQSLNDYLDSLEMTETEKRYLKTYKFNSKEKAVKYIIDLKFDEKKTVLKNFEPLINDMIKYLLKE